MHDNDIFGFPSALALTRGVLPRTPTQLEADLMQDWAENEEDGNEPVVPPFAVVGDNVSAVNSSHLRRCPPAHTEIGNRCIDVALLPSVLCLLGWRMVLCEEQGVLQRPVER